MTDPEKTRQAQTAEVVKQLEAVVPIANQLRSLIPVFQSQYNMLIKQGYIPKAFRLMKMDARLGFMKGKPPAPLLSRNNNSEHFGMMINFPGFMTLFVFPCTEVAGSEEKATNSPATHLTIEAGLDTEDYFAVTSKFDLESVEKLLDSIIGKEIAPLVAAEEERRAAVRRNAANKIKDRDRRRRGKFGQQFRELFNRKL